MWGEHINVPPIPYPLICWRFGSRASLNCLHLTVQSAKVISFKMADWCEHVAVLIRQLWWRHFLLWILQKLAEIRKTRPNTLICSPHIPHVIQNSRQSLCDLSHLGNYVWWVLICTFNIQINIIYFSVSMYSYWVLTELSGTRLFIKLNSPGWFFT